MKRAALPSRVPALLGDNMSLAAMVVGVAVCCVLWTVAAGLFAGFAEGGRALLRIARLTIGLARDLCARFAGQPDHHVVDPPDAMVAAMVAFVPPVHHGGVLLPFVAPPHECHHALTTRRGSSAKWIRIKCLVCDQIIFKLPRWPADADIPIEVD